ncbi:MAG TPA: septum formation initiator family protein [Candidatus Paceibacterota bacterium]|nr:septum formation initiator family protein [Candidatus Paceibacterota bacterium]
MNLLNSKIFTVFISVASVWILFSVISVEIEKDEIKKEEANIEFKITNIKRDNASLEGYIKNFKNPEFLEKEARLRLNYKASGEEVVFVHRDINSQKASSSGTGPSQRTEEPPNYKKWWHWLLGF